jgi:hypothetical protein
MQSPINVELRGADSDGNDYSIQVHLGAFFDNPPEHPKTDLLPAYSVEPSGTEDVKLQFDAQTYDEFMFPDPTFRGIFPGMTNQTLKRILRIDEEYGYNLRLYAYEVGSWSGLSNATITLQTAFRSYVRTTDMYGGVRFIILDQNQVPYRMFINYGTGEIELVGSEPFVITSRTKEYRTIYMPPQFTGLTLQRFTTPLRVELTWTPQSYVPVKIQRSVGSGSTPVDFDSTYSATYTDYNVTAGQTYRYRISSWSTYFYWNSIRPKEPFYSTIAEIVP